MVIIVELGKTGDLEIITFKMQIRKHGCRAGLNQFKY
jgi:hypothetical protein